MIVDAPNIAKLKSTVRQFELIAKRLHPKHQARMLPLLKRPFPMHLKPNYISFHMGTIVNQRYKRFPAPTSFSLLDLRSFSQDGKVSDDDYSLSEEEHNSEKKAQFDEDHGVPIHKSNSFYTLHCLGRKAELRKPLISKLSNKERQHHRNTLSKSGNRGWNAFDLSSDESDEDMEEDDLSDMESDESFTLDAVN